MRFKKVCWEKMTGRRGVMANSVGRLELQAGITRGLEGKQVTGKRAGRQTRHDPEHKEKTVGTIQD